jgi:hypothetical protein
MRQELMDQEDGTRRRRLVRQTVQKVFSNLAHFVPLAQLAELCTRNYTICCKCKG